MNFERRIVIWTALTFLLSACMGPAKSAGPIVVKGPNEGDLRWFEPESSHELGEGGSFTFKVDRHSVPYADMMAVVQTLAASGIPVHLHTSEDEVLYIVSGRGFAIGGEGQDETPIETGSVIYIPKGEWHGVRNADPDERMDILVVTTPVDSKGLGEFFRRATTKPGHPPLNLPEEEFLALFKEYGMELPDL